MPSTPTTKSQVQAYRFVLRRMQSALVRKDAVMLHDPMRTHSRATIVGVCLAALGLLGFLIWGILSPKPKAPDKDGIVIGKPSGQVYVMIAQPDRQLIPVFNMASARLLLYAQKQGDEDESKTIGGVGGPGTGGGSTSVVAPQVIDDNELRGIPKSRKVGIVDGPDLLPSADQRLEHNTWSVCDQYVLDDNLPDPASADKVETTVIAGVDDLGPELDEDESLVVRAPNDEVFLVYRTPTTANRPNTRTVRAKVDMDDASVTEALHINDGQVREITTGLLNAIPEVEELVSPPIGGRGDQPAFDLGEDLPVGSVFSVEPTGEDPQFYVVLREGIEEVGQTTGDLIRYFESPGAADPPRLSPEVVSRARQNDRIAEKIDDTTFPARRTEALEPDNFAVACLAWRAEGEGASAVERTSVHISKRDVPVPNNRAGDPDWVGISTPSADGTRIDHFYLDPGRAAVVRQATSSKDFTTGQITLISDRGVKYGVPNDETAQVLGLADQRPAPRSIIQLLPDGASLSVQDVEQSFDQVPHGPGSYPSDNEEPSPEGGGQSGGG